MDLPLQPVTPTLTPPVDRPVVHRARQGFLRDILEMVALVVVIYTFVNLMTARAIVDGPSMQPNFYTSQLVIINLFSYYFNPPARGDVVVLHNPSKECQDTILKNQHTLVLFPPNSNTTCDDLIKRVIGLPGETVTMKNGRVSINGTFIDEPYISSYCERSDCNGTWPLGATQYLVLGDNRPESYDGHSFGPIDRTLIVGRAWFRYWPLNKAGLIPRPTYPTLAGK